MTQSATALRCHDPYACALGQKPCPTPTACCCAPTGANASISESEKEKAAQHYAVMAREARAACLHQIVEPSRDMEAAQARPPLTDERIREIDDETHFHESPDWPVRFARAIEAEARKKTTP